MHIRHLVHSDRFFHYYVLIADNQEEIEKAKEAFYETYPCAGYGSRVREPIVTKNGLYIANADTARSCD